VAQFSEPLRQSLSRIGRIASGKSSLKLTCRKCFEARRNCACSALTSSAKSEHRVDRVSRKFPRRWLMPNCGTHIGCAGVPELLPKSSCFLSLRSAGAACSSQYPEPDLSSARSDDVSVDLVACATGRTLVEFLAMTVARLGALACWRLQ
jgi:hypothetical protein